MANHEKSTIDRAGVVVSDFVSDIAAHPFAQLTTLVFCIGWFALGLSTEVLAAGLAILSILLTQMVLNKQNERENHADRRDVAMHAKLDELLIASGRANNALAGVEQFDEEEITKVADRAHEETKAGTRN